MNALLFTFVVLFSGVADVVVGSYPVLDSATFDEFQRSVLPNTLTADAVKRVRVHVEALNLHRLIEVLVGLLADGTKPVVTVTCLDRFETPSVSGEMERTRMFSRIGGNSSFTISCACNRLELIVLAVCTTLSSSPISAERMASAIEGSPAWNAVS